MCHNHSQHSTLAYVRLKQILGAYDVGLLQDAKSLHLFQLEYAAYATLIEI
jgi:hypothetical protein